ncbi:MAG: 23S rRNA (adenine(2503)-C(2))-methyltransferase RlmN [Bacilli bacterium]|nr:23S rRNA (adenine(2503)-C(2))-methyltransferase RlmN [Bacilli bacterium]
MINIYSFTKEELEEYFISINEKKYRASQLYDFLYNKKINAISEVTTFSDTLKQKIEQDIKIGLIKLIEEKKEKDVCKYLFELSDKNKIETVIMKHNYGNSLCISTQVGCNMGCVFCESGRLKKIRNLETFEMVEQVVAVEKRLNERISHIVIMGIGEPFDNYDNVMKFIRIINDPKGLNIGARHITVSTCGIIPKIKQFVDENLQVNLAISLHASNNKLRDKLMPINKVYNLDSLMETVKDYINKTNRRVTFEYVMLEGINDGVENAKELVGLLKGINCYVNLIPYNETNNKIYNKSNKVTILQFYDILKKNNINVTVRREFGSNIDAACGQLRSKY